LEDAANIKYSPKKSELIIMSDIRGDENLQLYLISDKGGEINYITPEHSGSQVIFCSWNKKGNKILFSSNKRDKRFFDTYVYNFDTKSEECIFQSDDIHTYIPVAWSKNERYIAFIRAYTKLIRYLLSINRKNK
jgi:Tol biopolymer transport system component